MKLDGRLLIKRNKRGNTDEINMAVGLFTKQNEVGELEFEIDKENSKAKVNIDLFGQETAVEVDLTQIEHDN